MGKGVHQEARVERAQGEEVGSLLTETEALNTQGCDQRCYEGKTVEHSTEASGHSERSYCGLGLHISEGVCRPASVEWWRDRNSHFSLLTSQENAMHTVENTMLFEQMHLRC